MKKNRMVVAVVLIAAMAVMFGCKSDDGGGGGLGLPSKPVSVSKLTAFSGGNPASEQEALALLGKISSLGSALYEANDNAFETVKGMPYKEWDSTAGKYIGWLPDNEKKTTVKDSVKYSKTAGNATEGVTPFGKIAFTIDGNSEIDFTSTGIPYEDYKYRDFDTGDNYTLKTSKMKKTVTIPTFKLNSTTSVAAVIKVESKSSGKMTTYQENTSSLVGKNISDSDGTTKLAVALSISDLSTYGTYNPTGEKGAKIFFSYASKSENKKDAAKVIKSSSSSKTLISNIEVYGSDNKLLYTIQNDSTVQSALSTIINGLLDF